MKVETLSRESSPFNTPGWDLLAHLALITEFEAAFGVMFSADDVMDFVNLGDAEDIRGPAAGAGLRRGHAIVMTALDRAR